MRTSRIVPFAGILLSGILLGLSGCTSPAKPQLGADAQAEALSCFSLGLLAEAGGDHSAALMQFERAIHLNPQEERLYTAAVSEALQLQQADKATRLAEAFAIRQPNSETAQMLLARVYEISGQPDSAEPLLKKAVSRSPTVENSMALVRFYLLQHRADEAIELLHSAVDRYPEQAELPQLLGTLYLDQVRTATNTVTATASVEKGIACLKQSLSVTPDNPAAWQQLGAALQILGKTDEALLSVQKARQYAPEDLSSARQMLDLLLRTGQTEEAFSTCETLATETKTDPEAWIQYIAERTSLKKRDVLTGCLEKYIARQPDASVFYYAQLTSLYIDAERYTEAESLLQQALLQYPSDSRLHIILGHLHLRQALYQQSYEELKQIQTEFPETEWSDNPVFLLDLMIAAQMSGNRTDSTEILNRSYDKHPVILDQYIRSLLTGTSPVSTNSAVELLNTFHSQRPDAVKPLYYLMILQAEQKEYTEAIQSAEQLEKLVQHQENKDLLDGEFYYQYASLYERTGQLEKAQELFLKAIDLGEETTAASAQNYIAYMWAERGEKLDMALELVRKALDTDPENGAFLDTLGWVYYMQGRYKEALSELQKAIETEGDDPTVLEHMGDVHFKLGNLESAVTFWEKALKKQPDSENIRKRIEQKCMIRSGAFPKPMGDRTTTPTQP